MELRTVRKTPEGYRWTVRRPGGGEGGVARTRLDAELAADAASERLAARSPELSTPSKAPAWVSYRLPLDED